MAKVLEHVGLKTSGVAVSLPSRTSFLALLQQRALLQALLQAAFQALQSWLLRRLCRQPESPRPQALQPPAPRQLLPHGSQIPQARITQSIVLQIPIGERTITLERRTLSSTALKHVTTSPAVEHGPMLEAKTARAREPARSRRVWANQCQPATMSFLVHASPTIRRGKEPYLVGGTVSLLPRKLQLQRRRGLLRVNLMRLLLLRGRDIIRKEDGGCGTAMATGSGHGTETKSVGVF